MAGQRREMDAGYRGENGLSDAPWYDFGIFLATESQSWQHLTCRTRETSNKTAMNSSPKRDDATPDTLPESEVAHRSEAPTTEDSVVEGRKVPKQPADTEGPDSTRPDPAEDDS